MHILAWKARRRRRIMSFSCIFLNASNILNTSSDNQLQVEKLLKSLIKKSETAAKVFMWWQRERIVAVGADCRYQQTLQLTSYTSLGTKSDFTIFIIDGKTVNSSLLIDGFHFICEIDWTGSQKPIGGKKRRYWFLISVIILKLNDIFSNIRVICATL